MKTHFRKGKLVIIIHLLFFISCNESNLIDLPSSNEKLVLSMIGVTTNGDFIQTRFQEGWNIDASVSVDVLYNYSGACPTFTPKVQITEESKQSIEITEGFNLFQGCIKRYEHYNTDPSMSIESGKRYDVVLSDDNHTDVSSYYIHPEIAEVKLGSLDYRGKGVYENNELSSREGEFYELTFTIDDPAKNNYYELLLFYEIKSEGHIGTSPITFDINDPSYTLDEEIIGTFEKKLFDDRQFNGTSRTFSLNVFIDKSLTENNGFILEGTDYTENLVFILRNYSPELYLYLQESYFQNLSEQDPNGTPMPIQTNIEGGLGILGGYAENQVKIPVSILK